MIELVTTEAHSLGIFNTISPDAGTVYEFWITNVYDAVTD